MREPLFTSRLTLFVSLIALPLVCQIELLALKIRFFPRFVRNSCKSELWATAVVVMYGLSWFLRIKSEQ